LVSVFRSKNGPVLGQNLTVLGDKWGFKIKFVLYGDGFEDSMFEAKASSLRGQGQGQFSSRPRPRPVFFETKASNFEAKAKASDHDC